MNKYIHGLIREQFNINDIDFNDNDSEYAAAIFNKRVTDPEYVYKKIICNESVYDYEIDDLDRYVSNVKVKGTDLLQDIIDFYSEKYPANSLNWLDVSCIENMNKLFNYTEYNGDISLWDVSNVTDMACMFEKSKFNGDISKWDVHNVMKMNGMFYKSVFNGDISKWDVHNVNTMHGMFMYSQFDNDISEWDVSGVSSMIMMFAHSHFNQDISRWDVSNVSDFNLIFKLCPIKDIYKPEKFRKCYE